MKRQGKDMYNKFTKTKMLLANKQLYSYIPATKKMNKNSLKTMLQKEKMVYIKPVKGSLGLGVIRLEIDRKHNYLYQHGVKKRSFTSFDRMYDAIRTEVGDTPYLVQKGIRLLTYKGLIFDLRVMVQHNASRKWEVTGIVGRVAHPRKAVTNGSRGGTIYPIDTLLKPYLAKKEKEALLAKLRKIGLRSAKALTRGFPNKHIIGADIGLDRQMRPWIIEVNWNPDPCPFTKLRDRTMLRRILRYAKFYGNTYELKCTKAKQGLK